MTPTEPSKRVEEILDKIAINVNSVEFFQPAGHVTLVGIEKAKAEIEALLVEARIDELSSVLESNREQLRAGRIPIFIIKDRLKNLRSSK